MPTFEKKDSSREKKRKTGRIEERNEELRRQGRITARIIDIESRLKVIEGIYAIRMNDEGVRRVFLNDYLPTIGKIVGEVTLLTEQGETSTGQIRGFYKLQHNLFTLLIEEHFDREAL